VSDGKEWTTNEPKQWDSFPPYRSAVETPRAFMSLAISWPAAYELGAWLAQHNIIGCAFKARTFGQRMALPPWFAYSPISW
jgi:hypothetical protein